MSDRDRVDAGFSRALTLALAGVFLAPLAASSGCSGSIDDSNGLAGSSAARGGASGAESGGRGGRPNLSVGGTNGATDANAGAGTAAESGRGGSSFIDPNSAGADNAGAAGIAGEAGATTLGPDEACALSTDEVEAVPSVLELVIDTSGSMDWPPGWAPASPDDSKPPGATKWEITRDALRSAVAALGADVALGASFFPNTTDADDGITCLRSEAALPIGLLGASNSSPRKKWEAALDAVVPNGGTPTQGAYRFGLAELASTKLAGNRFLLLITDGTPTCTLACECTENNEPVDSKPLVEDAKAALGDGVRTFVIGSPGSEDTRDVLSALALEGGTAKPGCSENGPAYCHFDMTTESDLGAGLQSALETVAANLRSCDYPVPAPPDNRTLDPDRVNVLFTPSAGKTRTVPRDPSSDCRDGWHYTDDTKATIELCGDACAAAQSDVGAKVEVLIGCKTVSQEPR